MSNGTLARVTARTASEVCARFDIGDEARALLQPNHSPDQYIALLTEKKILPAALRFLAHALPKPESVWWACVCVRETAGATPLPAAKAALDAAEKWLGNPTEDNRRAAMPAAQAAGLATAAGSAALAVFVSGGSLGPPNVPPVPPDEHMTGQVVGGAVLLAAIQKEPEKAIDRFRAFLTKGIEVAKGTNRWPAKR
jgi:hypothetical protein